ncbi:MAG: InlB B-repeat-containing protein, partial [Tannerella sp.]|nr:InlB B-repeat-containing protein [Tannerella sp.]
YGGSIYNAGRQAVDYGTAASEGILVAPDEGYRFAGWSHDSYISHRGKRIAARSGIMYYDTLAVFGDVLFRAEFELNRYPIHYPLNDGENAADNPSVYTVESVPVTLAAPFKSGDVFTGWSGSNGDDPQLTVTIPAGSTGEREYYANYLYSGRESHATETPETDRIWSSGNEAYIRTSRSGSIARIYTPDGILRHQHTVLSSGITKFRLDPGIYIIKLNNGTGWKILIR